jgi:predicted permease
MNEIFVSSFITMFDAVAKIMAIAIIAGILVRKKIVKQEYIKGLSEITVIVLLPSLIFTKTISTFKPDETVGWWILPLIGMILPLVGILLSTVFFHKRPKHLKNIISLAAFPNAAYLVLPIGQIIFPEQFDQFALYCFLFIMGYNPMLWSLGKYYSTLTNDSYRFKFKELITPPLVANIASVLIVLIGLHKFIPDIIFQPVDLIGSATVPIATFVLGATLGGISFKIWPKLSDIIKVTLIRFVFIPSIMVGVLFYFNVHHYSTLFATFLIIESCAAPATNLIVMVRKYGGDTQQMGSLMLIMYFTAILAMPLWVAFWNSIT